jgi:hypothetical protein
MTGIFDEALETKKFQMYAEKADTVEKRIELCKKYLAAKKAKEQPEEPDPWDGPQYSDSKGIHRLEARFSLPEYNMPGISDVDNQDLVRKELIRGLSNEILKRGLYTLDFEKRMYEQDTIYTATAFIWKDPNK